MTPKHLEGYHLKKARERLEDAYWHFKQLAENDHERFYPLMRRVEQALDESNPDFWLENADLTPDEPDEPQEEDWVIFDSGYLGSKTAVVELGGKSHGEFDSMDDALAYIRVHDDANSYWPNRWYRDDHGGWTLLLPESERASS